MANAGDLEQPLLDDNGQEIVDTKVSRNVYVTYCLLFVWGLADSIWTGALLSAWLFLLAGGDPNPDNKASHWLASTGNFFMAQFNLGQKVFESDLLFSNSSSNSAAHANTVVGGVEALQGLAGLFTALPIGYLADVYGRAPICKVGGIGFLIAGILTLMALDRKYDEHTEIILMAVALVMWGISGGIYSGPSQALFADSVPKGQRSHYYTILQFCYMAPSIVGPIVAIILFQKYGDRWTYDELRLPFKVGVYLEFPAAVLSFFLRDDLALKESEDDDAPKEDTTENQESEQGQSFWSQKRASYKMPILGITLTRASIPYVLFMSDLFYSLGSGMTIKFFPLFFMKEVGLSPSAVQALLILVSVLLMMFSFGAQRLSKSLGRVQVVTLARSTGIVLLVALSLLVHHKISQWYIILPMYLLRTAFMNCSYPLDESILMDNVKKSERSRWKALESVSMFGWCGSALFGGWLADQFSYDFSFLITACLQACGALTYCLLVPLVLDEDHSSSTKNSAKEELAKRTSILLATAENELGSPRMNLSEVEEELIRPLQQSP